MRGSPRNQRARGRGRGCPVASESPARIHGGRSRIWRRRRLHGALRLAWLGEEVAGDEAELLGTTGRRGRGGGYGDARRRRRWFSGEREREQGEKRRARESESGAGQLRGFVRGIEGVRGKQEVASRGGGGARACRRASGTRPRPSVRGGGRQKAAGRWAGRQLEMGQVSGPGKSLSPFLFSFLIF